jgi:uncharacterized protein (DUF1015 family)
MAVVEGFRGIRFSLENGKDVSDRLAPPYDVLNQQGKAKLMEKSPHNIVAVDLPHMPPKSAGPESLYKEAGDRLRAWLEEGAMIRDEKPTIYVYQQRYTHQGRQYTRRGFIGRLKVEPFCEESVFPHEKTYGGPKEDRMMLTKATQVNMSQVFCIFDDNTNEITDILYSKISGQPTYTGEIDGVKNEVWTLTDPAIINWVAEKMKPRKIFIADGHHRYTTSLNYRNELEAQGKLTPEHPANYVGCVFVSMSEPGMVILPTHRCVTQMAGLTLDELAKLLGEKCETKWFDGGKDKAEEAMLAYGEVAFAFVYSGDNRILMAKPKDLESLLADLADEHILAWRTLPVAVLHSYVLDRVVYPKWLKTDEPAIEYYHLADEVMDYIQTTPDVLGVLTPTTKIEAVKEISLAGELMPQKSTFFYPKLATGLVIHPLFD